MAKKRTSKSKISIEKHDLMPKHSLCSDKEKEQLLEKYNASIKQLPRITQNDAGISSLNAKPGDLIKIERKDSHVGKVTFYRVVTDE
ncbi:MAG: DNA-directed RNA polymerase subunit RpoH/Rpb5 C-terminal domain-containing protein [Candidatus Woesearchaeota archaeon]